MKKLIIESVRTGISEGGVACGPVPGHDIAEAKYRDESGNVRYRSFAQVEGTLNFYTTLESTFDQQIAEEWPDEEGNYEAEDSGEYVDYDEFYDDFDTRPEEEIALDRLLIFAVNAEADAANELIDEAVGNDIGDIEIPACDIETDFLNDRIDDLLSEDDGDAVDALMERFDGAVDAEEVFLKAVRAGAIKYVDNHTDDFDLCDFDCGSRALSETDDPVMRDILITAGAIPDPEDYCDCRMVYDQEGGIFEMDDHLRGEMAEEILRRTGLTREEFAEKLQDEDGSCENMPEPLSYCTYGDIQSMAHIIDDDEVGEDADVPDHDDYEIVDLLDELGFDVEEEGQLGPHGHGGWLVRFIR